MESVPGPSKTSRRKRGAKHDRVASESSGTTSYGAIRIRQDLFEPTAETAETSDSEGQTIETEELLFMDEPGEGRGFDEAQDDDSDEYEPPAKEKKITDYIPLEYKIKVVNMVREHPKWSLSNLKKKGCSRLKSIQQIYRWREDIKRGGTTIDKYSLIDSWTYDRFAEARANYQQVTTRSLQQWALSAASQFHDFPFKASESWVRKFKQQHKIRQQKITKCATEADIATIDEILAAADTFRKETTTLVPNFHKDFIINTDQTRCQYQCTYDKTLRTNRLTRAYTAQYAITMSGKLLPRAFICLQEETGEFDAEVKKAVGKLTKIYTNVIVTSSKSGKFTTHLFAQFLKKGIRPYVKKDKFLLLLDNSNSGYRTHAALYDEIFRDDDGAGTCSLKVVPPKCTQLCQPCDVYFYRQVKNLIRHLQNCTFLTEQKRDISSREDCIKTHAIVHHQLSAPIFEHMLRYTWYASKLTNEREIFQNVNEVCFPSDILSKQPCDCKNAAFIRCARCRANYCFVCFYDKYHPSACTIPSASTNK